MIIFGNAQLACCSRRKVVLGPVSTHKQVYMKLDRLKLHTYMVIYTPGSLTPTQLETSMFNH